MISRVLFFVMLTSYLIGSAGGQQSPTSRSESPLASAGVVKKDLAETVVPITAINITPSIKMSLFGKLGPKLGIGINFGTGFCLDPACRMIATNYHVALTTRARKIQGEKIQDRYYATGPHDREATVKWFMNGKPYPYATNRDLAVLVLQHPLAGHHGLGYSFNELQPGQEVDIYGYPKESISLIRKLVRFPAKFRAPTNSGLYAFEFEVTKDKPVRIAGSSGGVVVDRKSEKIVGVLNEANDTMGLAVPIENLAEFVSKILPLEAAKIFPEAKEALAFSPDIYPKFVPPPDVYPKFIPHGGDGLTHRPQEPDEIRELRQKSQRIGDSMRNLIAMQSYSWGRGEDEPEAEEEYEVRIVEGEQTFRGYPDGKRELSEIPFPRIGGWVVPSDDWSSLAKMVGTDLGLKIKQGSDVNVGGHRMKVFQYYASIEDNLCAFRAIDDYVLFTIRRTSRVACYGEVWTDEDLNIQRISEHIDLSDRLKAYRGWEDFRVVMTYCDLKRPNEAPRRVPLSIFTQGRNKKKVYWCHGMFSDYKVFTSSSRIVPQRE
jgi:hypothetical protein